MFKGLFPTLEIDDLHEGEKAVPGIGGFSWQFLVGVCCPLLQTLTLFQTKKILKMHFVFAYFYF